MQIIKELLALKEQQEPQKAFNLNEMAEQFKNDPGSVMVEDIKDFIGWARRLLDLPVINKDNVKTDPHVDPKEADPHDVKDEADAFVKIAKIVAGLDYYMRKGINGDGKADVAKGVAKDREVDANLKDMAMSNAQALVKTLLADLKTPQRAKTLKMLDDLDKFYTPALKQTSDPELDAFFKNNGI